MDYFADRKDWLLQFVYRTTSVRSTVAGLHPITWPNRRIVNVDLSDIVSSIFDQKYYFFNYCQRAILARLMKATEHGAVRDIIQYKLFSMYLCITHFYKFYSYFNLISLSSRDEVTLLFLYPFYAYYT